MRGMRPPVVGRRAGLVGLLVVGLALLVCAACGRGEERAGAGAASEVGRPLARADLPNVVLVTLDTVRAESLGCYGNERDTSPHLDALAVRGTRFANAISTSNWTHPSHVSLFTGRFTFEHGARYLEPLEPGDVDGGAGEVTLPLAGLDPAQPLLAEMFEALGYDTAAFVANSPHLHPDRLPGIDRGFQTYVVGNAPPGRVLNRQVLRWLASRRGRPRPFFVFLNYMDAHAPYNTRPVAEWIAEEVPHDGRSEEILEQAMKVVLAGGEIGPRMRRHLDRLTLEYEAGIRNVDGALGQVLDRLETWGLLDDTLVVVTSDHGEFLGAHHLVAHALHLYQPGIHVPLVVKAPGQREGRVDERWVTLADVPGIVLSALPPDLARPWREQFRYAPGNHPIVAEQYFTNLVSLVPPARAHRILRTLVEPPWKLIVSSDGKVELYDLDADPAEGHDLAAARPDVAGPMRARLRAFLRDSAYVDGGDGDGSHNPIVPPPDEDTLEQLRALGYL